MSTTATVEQPLAGKRVLLIEDDYFLQDLLARKITQKGGIMSAAFDGPSGIEKASEETPDIILLDIVLPNMDGFEVLKKLKATPVVQEVPVIILSNLGQNEDLERGTRLGAAGFFTKAHLSLDEVVEKVRGALGS